VPLRTYPLLQGIHCQELCHSVFGIASHTSDVVATFTSIFYSSAHKETKAFMAGFAISHQSPLIVFLHFQRADPRGSLLFLPRFISPWNTLEFLTFRVLFLTVISCLVSETDPFLPLSLQVLRPENSRLQRFTPTVNWFSIKVVSNSH